MKTVLPVIASLLLSVSLLGSGSTAYADATISVSLTDYAVTPSASGATPGVITFNVSNDAPIIHDFHVIQTNLAPDALPVDQNVGQVDLSQVNDVASTPIIQPTASDSTAPNLGAASYVLICNLPGHYEAGMTIGFTVAQASASTSTPIPGQPTATLAPGETPGPAATDDTGGTVGGPVTGYGPSEAGSSNAWLFVLPLAGLAVAFGAAALQRARRTS